MLHGFILANRCDTREKFVHAWSCPLSNRGDLYMNVLYSCSHLCILDCGSMNCSQHAHTRDVITHFNKNDIIPPDNVVLAYFFFFNFFNRARQDAGSHGERDSTRPLMTSRAETPGGEYTSAATSSNPEVASELTS